MTTIRDQKPSGGCINCGAPIRSRKANGWVCASCDRLLSSHMPLTMAAERLGVTAATLRQQIAGGRLRASKVGRDWLVTGAEVDRYRRESLGKPGRR